MWDSGASHRSINLLSATNSVSSLLSCGSLAPLDFVFSSHEDRSPLPKLLSYGLLALPCLHVVRSPILVLSSHLVLRIARPSFSLFACLSCSYSHVGRSPSCPLPLSSFSLSFLFSLCSLFFVSFWVFCALCFPCFPL